MYCSRDYNYSSRSSISVLGSGPQCESVLVSSMFGGLGGGLSFGVTAIGAI